MSERDIYMHDIKVVFGKLKYQSYDELSDVDRMILSFAFSPQYSDVEIRYMLEELGEKTKYQPVFTKEEIRRILERRTISKFK